MNVIDASKTITTMTKDNPPIAYIDNGETVVVDTLDCFSGRIKRENDLLKNLPWSIINPATGPIYVRNAEPGDILKVSILDIRVGERAVVLCESEDTERYHFDGEEKSLFIDIVDGKAKISDEIEMEINPMIGVIGTAPESGSVLTTLPGVHGGNMDNSHITIGSVLYLPVFHEGALLSIGDLHALMGDGEGTGSGLEISGQVTTKIEVLKNKSLPVPMLMRTHSFETIASAHSLDEATTEAICNMLIFLTSNQKMDREDAWKLVTACGNVEICQFANALKTVRCCIARPVGL